MFGTANQLLAAVALAVATSAIVNAGKFRYMWVTLVPMLFVLTTTLVAGWENIFDNFSPLLNNPNTSLQGYINIILTVIMMVSAMIIFVESLRRWYSVIVKGEYHVNGKLVHEGDKNFVPPEYGCC